MDDLESNNGLVDTPLVSLFLDSDDDPDDGEVLNELEEYGNAGKLCRKKELYTTFSTLVGKLWKRRRSWVFDLNKSDLYPSFVEGLTAKGLGPSCGGFPY
ncbi:hypothetical protein Tco_1450591, partial [Tanacetum coccineum]